MDLDSIPLFKALTRRMAWLGERQQVLSQNIANSATPNYKPQDLASPSFAELIGKPQGGPLRLATTQPNDIAAPGQGPEFRVETAASQSVLPNGNGVSLEEQMLKVSDTASQFQLMTQLYRNNIAMLKTALGRSS